MEKCNATKFYKLKKLLHPVLIKAMSSKTTGKLNVYGKLPENGNYLIVANHVCIEDLPTLAQALKKHFLVLVSDEDKGTIDGACLELNGVEWVHRTSKESRLKVNKNIINMLKDGYTVAMYPEATWNLSPNNLIMNMNYGCIRMALEAGVPIIPVVSFFTEKERYTLIGDVFNPTENLEESINSLRNIMGTNLYKLMQLNYNHNFLENENIELFGEGANSYFYESRANIEDEYWEHYVDRKYNAYERARKDKNGVREFESQFIFTPKDEANSFFQEFNSIVRMVDGKETIERITSEANGYQGKSFGEKVGNNFFGYGYNEKVLKKNKKEG